MKRITLILFFMLLIKAGISQDVNLFFDFNSGGLRQNDITKLDELVNQYKQDNFRFLLRGYADTTGKSDYNLDLSKRRAFIVKDYLLKNNVKGNDITVEFYGETGGISNNQLLNRRVGIFFERPGQKAVSDYSDFIKKITPGKEVFEIPSGETISIEGKKGTIVTIPQNGFRYADGQPVEGAVKIELSEYYSIADIISKRLSTISGGNLLVTSGVVEIMALKDTTEIFLKDSNEISLAFPRSSNDRFHTFYGERLTDGSMDWKLDDSLWNRKQKEIGVIMADDWQSMTVVDKEIADKKNKLNVWDVKNNKFRAMIAKDQQDIDERRMDDSVKAEQSNQNFNNMEKYYSTISSRRLNWINCDQFLRDPSSQIIDYYVKVTNPGINVFNSYLVFDKIKSLLEMSFQNDGRYHSYARLPLKIPVHLLVTGTVNGKFFLYFGSVTLEKDKTESIELKESSFDELSALLKKI